MSKEKIGKKIALRVCELADLYALETLYPLIKDKFPDENIYFSSDGRSSVVNDRLHDYPKVSLSQHGLYYSKPDLVVLVESDQLEDLARYEYGPYRSIAIDASVLKACKQLPTESQIQSFKKEFGLTDKNGPLATYGLVHNEKNVRETKKLIDKIGEKAHIVLSSDFEMSKTHLDLNDEQMKKITEITGKGHLAKLYTLADVAFCGDNFAKPPKYSCNRLHNFYEQTQGGPIFLVPSPDVRQYGYKDFVNQGIIIPCQNPKDIIEQSDRYLMECEKNPNKKNEHRKKLEKHIAKSRQMFFPAIVNSMKYVLENGGEKQTFKFTHPESDWGKRNGWEDVVEIYNPIMRGGVFETENKSLVGVRR